MPSLFVRLDKNRFIIYGHAADATVQMAAWEGPGASERNQLKYKHRLYVHSSLFTIALATITNNYNIYLLLHHINKKNLLFIGCYHDNTVCATASLP